MSQISNHHATCMDLAQKYRSVGGIVTLMRRESEAFLQSPSTNSVPQIEDLVAEFENDLFEYKRDFINSAVNVVLKYLEQHNTGPLAFNGRLKEDEVNGRLTFYGKIDIQDESVTYFPALIKKIDGVTLLGAGITELPYLEEVHGSLNAPSKTDFRASRLKELYDLAIDAEETVELNELQEVRDIKFDTNSIILPKLKTARTMKMLSPKPGGNLELPELESVASIRTLRTAVIKIPKVTELFNLIAPRATTIQAPELKKVHGFMNIANLDPNIPFRSAFTDLKEVWNKEEISIFVKDEARMKEIEELRHKGLVINGSIEIE